MALGLGSKLSKSGIVTPGIVTDSLVLKHNYSAGSVVPLSDGAAFFDGVDDYISVSSATALTPSSITVSAWVKFPGEAPTDSYPRIADNDGTTGDGTDKGWNFRYVKSSNIFSARVSANGEDHDLIQSDSTYTDYNKWYHVAFTYNHSNGEGKIYIDGDHDGTDDGDITGALNDSGEALRIGGDTADNQMWDGYICNVGVWSAVLTHAQIKSIMWKNYAGLTSSETTSLVSWWNLSADANDSHGSNNGTLA